MKTVTIPANGVYTIADDSVNPSTLDNYFFLYTGGGFNPSNPLANVLLGNRAAFGTGHSGFSNIPLTAGTYDFVSTTFNNGDAGSFNVTVSTPPTLGTPTSTINASTAPVSGSPTFNRPSGTTSLSSVGTNVFYQVQSFVAPVTGVYNITSTTTYENYLLLYKDSFNPATPLVNILATVDGFPTSGSLSSQSLTAGKTYFIVATTYSNGVTGPYTVTVTTNSGTPVFTSSGSAAPTGGSPSFSRPTTNGTSPPTSVASSTGSFVYYDAHSFTVPATGSYKLASLCVSPASWDDFTILYKDAFNPASPLTNALIANDDLSGASSSGFTVTLTAGTTYIFVTTSYFNATAGTFSATVTPAAGGPATVSYTGALTTGTGPTYNRVNANGTAVPTALSTSATATFYEAKTFTVPTTGSYNVISSAVSPTNWDNYTTLYNGPFNPAAPLTNALIANDNQPTIGLSGFAGITLTAGVSYTLVTAGAANSNFGSYNLVVSPNALTTVLSASGNLIAGSGATIDRPDANGTAAPVALSATATATFYHADAFTVPNTGLYSVLSQATTPANWNNYTILYAGAFDPANPLTNAVIANDNQTTIGVSGFSITLTKGVAYTLVTTGATNADFGAYMVTVAPITGGGVLLSYTDSTTAGTGPNFNAPAAGAPPTALSTTATATFYHTYSFTPTVSGTYGISSTTSNPTGWSAYFTLYNTNFNPNKPLNDAVVAGAGSSFTASLTANTTYIVVTSGVSNGSYGDFHNTITLGPATYPPVIPDNNPAGLSLALTVPDTFSVGALNSVTVLGLNHAYLGDLVATLTHKGVTIELFDRVGRLTNSGFGSNSDFAGDYTFAQTGVDLSTITGVLDPSLIYAQYLNGTAGQSDTYTGDFTAFNGLGVDGDWTINIADNGLAISGTYTGFSFTVTPAVATASVSGTIAFEGIVATAAAQNVTFTFRPTGGGADIVKTASVGPSGVYLITGLPKGTFNLLIKGDKNLAALVAVNTTTTNPTGVNVSVAAGDCNNDNSVDPTDFNIFVSAYNSSASIPGTGYDSRADFNGDGQVDPTDFGLFVGDYNTTGAKLP